MYETETPLQFHCRKICFDRTFYDRVIFFVQIMLRLVIVYKSPLLTTPCNILLLLIFSNVCSTFIAI